LASFGANVTLEGEAPTQWVCSQISGKEAEKDRKLQNALAYFDRVSMRKKAL
jgi:hypothetical protein